MLSPRLHLNHVIFLLALIASLLVGRAALAQEANSSRIVVEGQPVSSPTPSPDDTRPKLQHIMREVSGTQITVTKKATVIKLKDQPPVENNDLQTLFLKAPGLIVSEQQNPGQFNFSY